MEIIQAITRCINAKWNENTEGVFVFEITECKSCLFFHILLLLLSQSLNIPLDLIFVSFVSSLILLSSFQFDLIEFIYDTIGYFVDIWCQFTQVFFQFTSNFFSPILLIFQIFMRIYWNFLKMKEVTHPLRIRRPTRIVLDRLCSSTNPNRKAPRIHDPRYDSCSYERIN